MTNANSQIAHAAPLSGTLVALFIHMGTGNCVTLFNKYQSCIRSARPKKIDMLNLLTMKKLMGNLVILRFILLLGSVSGCKTFINFGKKTKRKLDFELRFSGR